MVKQPYQKLAEYIRQHFSQALYSNGYFILLAALIPAALGYVFWGTMTRLLNADQVGIASTLISVTAFLTLLSGLDLGTLLIRYIPQNADPSHLINTVIWLRILLSAIASSVFLLGLGLWSPAQAFLAASPALIVGFVLANVFQSVNELLLHLFVAYRQARLGLLKNIYVALVRFPIVALGVLLFQNGFNGVAVFLSVQLGVLIIVIYAFWKLVSQADPSYHFRFEFTWEPIRKLYRYSALNFVGEFSLQVPPLLLPVIIANRLGNKESGIAYVVIMVSSMVAMLPQGLARSLFSESAHDQSQLRANLRRVLTLSLLLELILIVGIIIFGRLALALSFGPTYADSGTLFLFLSSLAVVPMTVVLTYFSVQRIRGHIFSLMLTGLLVASITLALTTLLTDAEGLTGVGIGLLVGQAMGALFTLPSLISALRTPDSTLITPLETVEVGTL